MVLRDDTVMFFKKLFSPISLRGNSVQYKYSQTGKIHKYFQIIQKCTSPQMQTSNHIEWSGYAEVQ